MRKNGRERDLEAPNERALIYAVRNNSPKFILYSSLPSLWKIPIS